MIAHFFCIWHFMKTECVNKVFSLLNCLHFSAASIPFKGQIDVVYADYYAVWVMPYGVSMLCVLTLSLSSWLCATSLLKYTWIWAIIQRAQDVCGSRITFWHKIGLNEISCLS